MDNGFGQKCRTCLKTCSQKLSLKKFVMGITPKSTYGQLLEECAGLECTTDYEHLMPQSLCTLCCQELSNAYIFIRQAQYCNSKLIKLIDDGALENTIRMPQNAVNFETSINYSENYGGGLETITTNELENSSTNVLKLIKLEEINENCEKFQMNAYDGEEKDINNSEGNDSIDLQITHPQMACNEQDVNNIHIKIENTDDHDTFISKELDSLGEKTNHLPEIENTLQIKIEKYVNNFHITERKEESVDGQKVSNESSRKQFQASRNDGTANQSEENDGKIFLLKEQNDPRELRFEYSETVDNEQNMTCFEIKTEGSLEHNDGTENLENEKDFQNSLCVKMETNWNNFHTLDHIEENAKTNKKVRKDKNEQFERLEECELTNQLTDNAEAGSCNNKLKNWIDSPFGQLHVAENEETFTISEIKIEEPEAVKDIERPNKKIYKKRQTFDCHLCSSKCKNKSSYIYHLKDTHGIIKEKSKNKEFKCQTCDYIAKNRCDLHYHTRLKHGTENDKFKCQFCPYQCIRKNELFLHIRNIHKEIIRTLKAESEKYDVPRDALNESSTSSLAKSSPLQDDNSKEYSSDDNIPLSQKTTNSVTKVDDDEEQFSGEEFLRVMLHMHRRKRQTKPSTKSLARRCDECGKVYKNYKALHAHKKSVHISEDKYSPCPYCDKKYKRKADVKIHVEKVHVAISSDATATQERKIKEKRFMCSICSHVTTTSTNLNLHVRRHHTGEKPYKCEVCFKSFVIAHDLKIHSYLHTGELPFKCPICSRGFRKNSYLLKHKRVHSGEEHKCDECGKFVRNLHPHKKIHLKEKKLNCLTCGKIFKTETLLNLHRINENHPDQII